MSSEVSAFGNLGILYLILRESSVRARLCLFQSASSYEHSSPRTRTSYLFHITVQQQLMHLTFQQMSLAGGVMSSSSRMLWPVSSEFPETRRAILSVRHKGTGTVDKAGAVARPLHPPAANVLHKCGTRWYTCAGGRKHLDS